MTRTRWTLRLLLALSAAAAVVELAGCLGGAEHQNQAEQTPGHTGELPTASPSPSAIPTPTETPVILPSPSASPEPTLPPGLCAPAPTYTLGSHQILAPILLYHHVGEEKLESGNVSTSQYDVTPANFEAQLRILQKLGYHTVGVSQIASALLGKGTLPQRPIAITVDDGWADEYGVIFPLLQKYGDVGTFYIPSTYPGAPGTVTWDQLKEMASAGMEIGSHSQTHGHLASMGHDQAWAEVRLSKVRLEKELGITVQTFAYPFGETSLNLFDMVRDAGYLAAVNLGGSPVQGLNNLFDLDRIEIASSESLAGFLNVLPWRGQGTALCPGG